MNNTSDEMRRERRWTFIFFNLLLLAAALMQWFAVGQAADSAAAPGAMVVPGTMRGPANP